MPLESETSGASGTVAAESQPRKTDAVHLPSEVISIIVSFIRLEENPQRTLYSCCLISRSWYSVAVAPLYRSPVLKGKNYQLFVRTICPSINAHIRKSPLSEFVRTLNLSALTYEGSKSVMGRLLGRVKGGLEVFVAPQVSFAVNSLAALSKCHKLVRLDLSLICESLRVLDLLHAVTTLSCLKIFHFPRCAASPHPGEWRQGRGEAPKWPDSIETFHVPASLSLSYIPAFCKAPASLTTLVLEDSPQIADSVLGIVFEMIGSRVVTLKVEYYQEVVGQLARIFRSCPNLLHLSIQHCFVSDLAMGYVDLEVDYPLRSITIYLKHLNDILEDELLDDLSDLIHENRLPDLRCLLLSNKLTGDRWVPFLQENADLELHQELLGISERLKKRSNFASGLKGNGVWLVEGDDSNDTICEFNEEDLASSTKMAWQALS